MNGYGKQKEHYDKAMKGLVEMVDNFQKLTPQNRQKFAEQVFGTQGLVEIMNMLQNQR